MKITQTKRKMTTWKLARWLVPLVVLPLLAMAMLATWIVSQEFQAQRQYQHLTQPFRAAGYPLGDAWAEHTFRERTHTDGSAAWSKILMLSTALDDEHTAKLPMVGSGKRLPVLDPAQAWPENQNVHEFLSEARPLIDLVQGACSSPAPVWQPLQFNGYATLLHEIQQSRSIMRILQLDFEHALYNDDAPRAMAAVKSMQATIEAFDWDMFLVGVMVNHALRTSFYESIQRSLAAQRWDEQQLTTLMNQLLTPEPVAEKWRTSLQSEQALVYSVLENSADTTLQLTMLRFPTAKLVLMRAFEDSVNLASASASELARRADEYERAVSDKLTQSTSLDMALVGQFLPAISAYARSFEKVEENRLITLTAVALKRFQLAHRRWPQELSELAEFGLSATTWTVPEVGSLGYEFQEDTATLWGSGADREISSKLPQFQWEELSQGVTADGYAMPTIVLIR